MVYKDRSGGQAKVAVAAFILIILAAKIGAGCAPGQSPSTLAAKNESGELEHIRLPMGFIPNVQFAPFYVAVDRGYFAKEGIEIEFDYGFETQGVQLVAAGELPFAVASGDQVILARTQELPVVYVAEWWQRFPVAIASLAEAGIVSPKDLLGRSVGIPELFGASFIGWQALVSAAHLDASQISLEAIGYSQVPSLSEGRVEAAVVYANNEPVLLDQSGLAANVIDVADYADIVANGIVTSESVIDKQPELVRRFLRAFLHGLADTLADPSAAFNISTRFVDGLTENAEFGKAVLDATLPYWRAEKLGYSDADTWIESQQVMRDAGLIDTMSEVQNLFTNEFLAELGEP